MSNQTITGYFLDDDIKWGMREQDAVSNVFFFFMIIKHREKQHPQNVLTLLFAQKRSLIGKDASGTSTFSDGEAS